MKARQRKLRESGKSKGRSREWAFYVFEKGHVAGGAWGSHKGLESLCRNGVRQKQTKLGQKWRGWQGLVHWIDALQIWEQFGGMSGAQGETVPLPCFLLTFVQQMFPCGRGCGEFEEGAGIFFMTKSPPWHNWQQMWAVTVGGMNRWGLDPA